VTRSERREVKLPKVNCIQPCHHATHLEFVMRVGKDTNQCEQNADSLLHIQVILENEKTASKNGTELKVPKHIVAGAQKGTCVGCSRSGMCELPSPQRARGQEAKTSQKQSGAGTYATGDVLPMTKKILRLTTKAMQADATAAN